MKIVSFALAMALAIPAFAAENGDPFSTGDSYGPRGGDFYIRGDIPVWGRFEPTEKFGVKTKKCREDIQAPGVWMECNPEFQTPAPGAKHPR